MRDHPAGADSEPRAVDWRPKWLARLGAGAFLFFLIKGLLWLMIPALAWMASRL